MQNIYILVLSFTKINFYFIRLFVRVLMKCKSKSKNYPNLGLNKVGPSQVKSID